MTNETLLTLREVAASLRLSASAVETLIRDPAHPLPVVRVGGVRRVRPEVLQVWLAGCADGTPRHRACPPRRQVGAASKAATEQRARPELEPAATG